MIENNKTEVWCIGMSVSDAYLFTGSPGHMMLAPCSDYITDHCDQRSGASRHTRGACDAVPRARLASVGHAVQESVIAALEKVCYLVPTKFRQTCDMFVDMYGELLIRVLLEDAAPDVVCSHLKLCLSENVPFKQPVALPKRMSCI